MSRSRKLKHFSPKEPSSGPRPRSKGDVFGLAEDMPTPMPSQAESIVMLREMLDAVLEENNKLREENLKLQNELDQERAKKLHSS